MRILKIICLLHQGPAGLERVKTMVIHSVMTLIANPKNDYEKSKLKRSGSRCLSMNGRISTVRNYWLLSLMKALCDQLILAPLKDRSKSLHEISDMSQQVDLEIGTILALVAKRSFKETLRQHQGSSIDLNSQKPHIAPCLLRASGGWNPDPYDLVIVNPNRVHLENGQKNKRRSSDGAAFAKQAKSELGNCRSFLTKNIPIKQ